MFDRIIERYRKSSDEKKKWVGHLFFPLKFLIKCINELRFDVYAISGTKNTVYLTSGEADPGFIEYFYPGSTIIPTGTIFIWSLHGYVRRHETVILDMHHSLARFFTDGIISVHSVRQVFDLVTPIDNLFNNRDMKRERKKIEKFQAVFSSAPEDLEFFYERIYLPFIQKRHKHPIILKKVFLEKDLGKTGELCIIKKDGEIIAGQFCNLEGDTYTMVVLGLADECYLKEGVNAAIYYSVIMRARERGATSVDFGLTRPFLSDGLLAYKRKWGGRIRRDQDTRHVIYLKNIVKDGLIILEHNKLKAVVLSDNDLSRNNIP
jgi:hypothetical protein